MSGHPAVVSAGCVLAITANNVVMLTAPPFPATVDVVEIVTLTFVLLGLMAWSVFMYRPKGWGE